MSRAAVWNAGVGRIMCASWQVGLGRVAEWKVGVELMGASWHGTGRGGRVAEWKVGERAGRRRGGV